MSYLQQRLEGRSQRMQESFKRRQDQLHGTGFLRPLFDGKITYTYTTFVNLLSDPIFKLCRVNLGSVRVKM